MKELVKSAHDVSDGGLACCLAESAIAGGRGAVQSSWPRDQRPDLLLFGEAPGLIVVTVAEKDLETFCPAGAGSADAGDRQGRR